MLKKIKTDKKGFTLTELIAVIVILGVLSTFVIIGVTRYINNTKEKTYESYETSMKKAAESMMIECASGKGNCFDEVPESSEKNKISYSDLLKKGYIDKLKDPEKEGEFCDGYVEVTNNSSGDSIVSNLSYNTCLKCSNYKTSSNSTCNFEEINQEVEEDKVYALCDNEDSKNACCTKFSESIAPDSIFTTWTNSDRTIKFGCSNGNCKYQKTYSISIGEKIDKDNIEIKAGKNLYKCEVSVKIDKIKPTCSIVLSTAVPSNNGWYNQNVTMKLSMDNNSEKTIINNGISTSSKTIYNDETELTVQSGITTVFGYVKDSLGNEGRCEREVKVDSNKPEQDLALGYKIYPEEKNKTTSTTNKLTIKNLEKYESIKGIVIYLNEAVNQNIGINYKKGETTVNKTINSTSQTVVKNILDSDILVDSIAINIQPSKIDKVYLIVSNSELEEYTNKDMIVYIYGSQSVSGVASSNGYSFNGGTNWQDEPYKEFSQNQTVTTKVKGSNGTTSSNTSISIFQIDKQAPTVPTITFKKWSTNDINDKPTESNGKYTNLKNYSPGTWSDKKIYTMAKGSTDSGVSGLDHYEYTTGGDTTLNTNEPSTYRNIEEDGESTIKYRACDKAGNCSSYTNLYTIKIDTVLPNITVTAYKLNNDNTVGSKINSSINGNLISPENTQLYSNTRIRYSLESSSKSAIKSLVYLFTPGGIKTYDGAGELLADAKITLKNETEGQTSDGTIKRTITYNSSDINYSFNFEADGAREMFITITNEAGQSRSITLYGKIDRTKPSCNGVVKTTTYSSSGVSGNVKCSDSMSGCEKSTYSFGPWKTGKTITIKDKAGNTNTCNVSVDSYNCNCSTCGGGCKTYSYRNSCFNDTSHNTAEKCRRLEGDSATFNSTTKECCMSVRYCSEYNSTYSCNCSTCYY